MKSQNEEQVERLSKMSFALGEATILVVLFSQYLARKDAPLPMPEASILRLIDRFLERCNQIYYEPEKEEPFKGSPTLDDPIATIDKRAEPYTKEWQNRCTICNGYHDGLGQAPCKLLNCS